MSTSDKDNVKNYAGPGEKLIYKAFGVETSEQETARKDRDAARYAAERNAQNAARTAAEAGRNVQFETRRQSYDDMADASGISRTGSDTDLLGFVGSRKRAGAARRILGD